MNEKPVESIRESNRRKLDISRKEKRYRASIQRSGISLPVYTPEQLHEMAVKLRKKKEVNKEFLTELSQALAENKQNATVFMGVDGVLQSLCSFLTGNDASLQLEATYCLVNAALWEDDTKNTSLIGSMTGAYLITLISSGSPSLQEACCWAISNLLPQSKTVMNALDLVGCMVKLFSSPFDNVRSASIQCLVQFIKTSPQPEDLVKVSSNLKVILQSGPFDSTSFSWMIYFLSCHECCDLSDPTLINWCLTQLSTEKKITTLIPIVRFLSNLSASNSQIGAQFFIQPNFESVICDLLNSPYEAVRKETFVFMSNIINSNCSIPISDNLMTASNAVSTLFG